jgi:serine/threonine-protein kinase
VKLKLTVVAGPHQGKEFEFDGHDTFLVGRTKDAHFQFSYEDPYFSRRHFLLEMNPPRCRVLNLSTRNGTLLNGVRVESAEVRDGDEISAGHTVMKVRVVAPDPDEHETLNLPPGPKGFDLTSDYQRPPVTIPGYRIEGELGRGAMGVVLRARRERDGGLTAIKTITPAPGASRKQIDRFLREAKILARLKHANIVAFHDVGEAGDLVYLAMELVEGPNLGERLRAQGPHDVSTGVRIICHILSGLAHAHASGFVHRDIKPSNILIGPAAEKRIAKLADFGLARVFESSHLSGLTMQGEVGGTPAYMAPEQVTHYREVKPAADQYSIAATLYKILTDQYTRDLPKDLGAQLALIVTSEPVPITQRRADIPPKLAQVIHKALAREPGERYPDVMAFRQELKRFA